MCFECLGDILMLQIKGTVQSCTVATGFEYADEMLNENHSYESSMSNTVL